MSSFRISQDLKSAARALSRSPRFSAAAMLLLALGIGASVAAVNLFNAVLLTPPPYPRPEELVQVSERTPEGYSSAASTLTYLDWARQNAVFSSMAAVSGETISFNHSGSVEAVSALKVTADYFKVFELQAARGRTFGVEEEVGGRDRVIVVSHAFWTDKLGADPAAIGEFFLINGEPNQLIGVLPRGTTDRGSAQIWRPLAFSAGNLTRNYHWLTAFARLKKNLSLANARAALETIGSRIAQDHPDSNRNWRVNVESYAAQKATPRLRLSFSILLAITGSILLICCLNLAGLMLARGLARERELAIRISLGASRGRLVQQLLTENLLVTAGGVLGGLALGYALIRWCELSFLTSFLPAETVIAMDWKVTLVAVLAATFIASVVGFIPAYRVSLNAVVAGLRTSGLGATASVVRQRMWSGLMIVEVALAFVLLTSAGVLMRSFQKLNAVEVGFDPSRLVIADVPISDSHLSNGNTLNLYLRRITEAMSAIPGVSEVALTSAVPMRASYGMGFDLVGKPLTDRANRAWCYFKTVSPAYFSVLHLKLVRGRQIGPGDSSTALKVAVINQAMARQYFSSEEPIGKQILIPEILVGQTALGRDQVWEVVGVVDNEKIGSLTEEEYKPCVYVNTEQSPQVHQSLLIRTGGDPRLVQKQIMRELYKIEPEQALLKVTTLEKFKAEATAGHELGATLVGIFAALAVGLSASGIYGLLAYAVTQRTRELGIRAALGATPGAILRLILRRGISLVATGFSLGLVGTLLASRVLGALLFGINALDPITLLGALLVLGLVALGACAVPAWRAARVDPLEAIKHE